MNLSAKAELVLNNLSTLLTPKRVLVYSLALAMMTWTLFFIANLQTLKTDLAPHHMRHADFVAIYSAGLTARTRPEKLYDIAAQQATQRAMTPSLSSTKQYYYLYPPFFSILLMPLSQLPYVLAYWVWTTASVLLYLISILILISILPSARPRLGHILGISLAAPALFWCIWPGQTTTVSLFIWSLALYWTKHGRPFFSGLTLGLLAYRFQFLIILVPLVLLKKFWGVALGLTISSLVLITAGGLVFSFQSYTEHFGVLLVLLKRIEDALYPFQISISLYSFFRPLLPNSIAIIFTLLGAALLVYWLAKVWRGRVEPEKPAFDLQFSMTLTTTLLLMHQGLLYDLMLLTIPALLMYEHRSFFPPHYKLLLALLYFAPYYAPIIAARTGFNPTQPLLIWLSYEIYRGSERMRVSSSD